MRLTNTIVENVTSKVMKHRFTADVLDLRCAEAKLFGSAWAHIYSKAEQKFLIGAPDGFVSTTVMFRLRIGGQRHELDARGSSYGAFGYCLTDEDKEKLKLLPFNIRCAVADRDGYTETKLSFAADDEGLPAAVVALASKKADLVSRIKEAEQKVTAAISGTTRAKAILLWPEIEPFLPEESKPAGLPALPTKELNALLDLPVSEAA